MNTNIIINLLGKDNIQGMLKSATGHARQFATEVVNGNRTMAQSSEHAATSINKVGSTSSTTSHRIKELGTTGSRAGSDISNSAGKASTTLSRLGEAGAHAGGVIHHGSQAASHGLSTMGTEGGKAGEEIARGGETASHALGRTGEAGRSAGRSISQGATTASKGVDQITASAGKASSGLGEMGDLLGMIMGGVGLAQIGNMIWTGATERQFNQAYLSMKLGEEQAKKMAASIEEIVAAVPGDDTFMNTLLGSAAARGAAIEDLQKLGYVAADYLIAAKKTGQTQIEAQQDLNAYIMTGTTGELERSRVLAGQVDKLKGKESIHERILALDEALKANGYEGLSQMQIMAIKWDTFKGKIQVAATEIGTKILPYLEKGVDFLLELDEKTGGWSTMIGLAGAGIAALAVALGPVVWSFKEVLGSMGGISDKLKGITGKKHKVDFDCGKPCPPISSTSTTGTIPAESTTSRILGKVSQWGIPAVSSAAGSLLMTQGLPTLTRLGSLGMSVATSGARGLQWLAGAGGTAASSVLGPAIMGLDLPGNPLWNIKHGKELIDWSQLDFVKSNLGGAFDTSKKGSLGDQLNLPGWIQGQLGGSKKPQKEGGGGITGTASIGTGLLKGMLEGISDFKLPQLKWPNAGQILAKIMDVIKAHIPKFNWKIPSVGQILEQTWDKIRNLIWKIPSVGQFLNQTWQKIKQLIWNIPSVGSLLSQTWQKITQLVWQVPGLGSILSLISDKIPSFHWPMGPGPSGPAGPGSSGGLPRGPIKNTIASTMANRSGVGQGYIMGAMNRNFKGVDAFNSIADGMAAHLGYQFYFGDQKSNQQVWDSGSCNCYDGAQFLMSEASQRFGLGAGLANGVWDGTGIAHTWSVIGGRPFDMAAKLIRGHWNPPSGPAGSFEQFMTDIGPGLEYMGYAGHQMDPVTALSEGGNCYDMTLGAMMVAENLWGLPTQMIWGTYDGNTHVWAKIDGKDYDPARRAREGTYNPPPQGPGPGIPGSLVVEVGGIHIHGPIHGVDDLDNRLKKAEKDAGESIAARIFGHYGG